MKTYIVILLMAVPSLYSQIVLADDAEGPGCYPDMNCNVGDHDGFYSVTYEVFWDDDDNPNSDLIAKTRATVAKLPDGREKLSACLDNIRSVLNERSSPPCQWAMKRLRNLQIDLSSAGLLPPQKTQASGDDSGQH